MIFKFLYFVIVGERERVMEFDTCQHEEKL